jgi:hypothetical protein
MAACVVVPFGPACVNLTGVRANDRNLMTGTITAKGTPVDLTGFTLTSHAKKKRTDEIPAIVAEITVTDAAAGSFSLRWPGDQVMTTLAGKASWDGEWDLQMDDSLSDPVTVVEGKFNAVMDVTRP